MERRTIDTIIEAKFLFGEAMQPSRSEPIATTELVFHVDNTIQRGEEWVWVFGSNLAGRHGKGAAKVAHDNFKASHGVGEGPVGRAYALPTKDRRLKVLPLSEIRKSIDQFLRYATAHPEKKFFITRVGCELAGYQDQDIAPLFAGANLSNLSFAEAWRAHLSASPSQTATVTNISVAVASPESTKRRARSVGP